MVEPALFGPLDAVLAPVVEYVVLALVLANLVTRLLAHRSHADRADDDVEALGRYPLHEASNVLLVLGSFYYLSLHQHSGIVLTTLVVGMVIADVFEFEARNVEVREGLALERPKGAMFASIIVTLYALYLALFFLVDDLWYAIV